MKEKFVFNNPKITINTMVTIIFYLFSIVMIIIANTSDEFKSGPCSPNLDLISFFVIGPISFILAWIYGVVTFIYKKATRTSFFIHLLSFLIWLTVLIVNEILLNYRLSQQF